MIDLRRALADRRRDFAPAPGGFERLVRRRRRRVRNRRIEAGVLALLVTAGGTWAAVRAVGGLTQPVPNPSTLDASNVGDLRLAWSAPIGNARIPAPPVVADDTVYVSSDSGVEAFPASCRSRLATCRPLWTGQTGPSTAGQPPSMPVVADGVVYVSSDRLYAFAAQCGTGDAVCEPLWTSSGPGWPFSGVSVEGGTVYVGADRLYAFPAVCPTTTCGPEWASARRVGSPGFYTPRIAGGVVYAASGDGLLAFPTRCGAEGSVCRPLWTFPFGDLGEPAVADGLLYVVGGIAISERSATLEAFPVLCSNSQTCRPEWTASPGSGDTPSAPVVADGVVYVSADRLYAFSTHCAAGGRACRPLWMGPTQVRAGSATPWAWAAPVVQGDLVFSSTDRVYAFAASCANSRKVCRPLWVGPPAPKGFGLSTPAVTDRAVLAASAQGVLYAYELPGRGRP
jgi:outer membrane protein assembly factor BamB